MMMTDLSPPPGPISGGGAAAAGGGGGSSTASFEEIGSEDDVFSTYIDVDKLAGGSIGSGDCAAGRNCTDHTAAAGGGGDKMPTSSTSNTTSLSRPRHRHSNSMDGGSSMYGGAEIMEAKKAMPPDKLAELWNLDPKRAKRSSFFFSFQLIRSFLFQFFFLEICIFKFEVEVFTFYAVFSENG